MRSRLGSLSIATPIPELLEEPVGLNTWYRRKVHNINDKNAKARMGRATAIVRVSSAPTEVQKSRIRIIFNACCMFS